VRIDFRRCRVFTAISIGSRDARTTPSARAAGMLQRQLP